MVERDKKLFEAKYRVVQCCNNCTNFDPYSNACLVHKEQVDGDGYCVKFARNWQKLKDRGVFHWLKE